MKFNKFYFIPFFVLIAISIYGQAPWERVTPSPQEHTLNDICKIPGTDILVATGWGSSVMISENGGETWNIKYHPAEMDNGFFGQCIYFLNSEIGFIGGSYKTILKTTNGGYNWDVKYSSGNNWNCFDDIAFCNETTGFAVGDYTSIKKTVDGGETWIDIEAGNDFNLHQVEFCNETTGYILGSSSEYILKTIDSGSNWQIIDYPSGLENHYLSEIFFTSETIGYILSGSGYPYYVGVIYKTMDSGESWNIVNSSTSLFSCTMDFLDEQHGIIGAQDGMYSSKILLTEDGGESWVESIMPGFSYYGANSVCFLDDEKAFCVGNMGMMFNSADGGNNWEATHQRVFYGDIYDVQFLDQQTGFALAQSSGGVSYSDLKKTTDGGDSWENIGGIINDNGVFWFANQDLGYLTTIDFGLRLYKTNDGGGNWEDIETGFDFEPFAIKFLDENIGLIAGEMNAIIMTTDAGNSWEQINYDFTTWAVLYDIEFVGDGRIFIVGGLGSSVLIESVDGGDTWEENVIGSYGAIKDMCFVDSEVAFLACEDGVILKTIDSGETWFEAINNSLNLIQFQSIFFPTEDIGYAVGAGSYETMVKTTDGGETWNTINSNSTSGLSAAYFSDENNGLVFGENGIVLKTTTGGVTGFEEIKSFTPNSIFEVYPNPFTDKISISLEARVEGGIVVSVFDLKGELVLNKTFMNTQKKMGMELSALENGIYFCNIKCEGLNISKKIIKTK